jgi:hypothetical protein
MSRSLRRILLVALCRPLVSTLSASPLAGTWKIVPELSTDLTISIDGDHVTLDRRPFTMEMRF